MRLQCTACKKKYQISDEQIPAGTVETPCPSCSVMISLVDETTSRVVHCEDCGHKVRVPNAQLNDPSFVLHCPSCHCQTPVQNFIGSLSAAHKVSEPPVAPTPPPAPKAPKVSKVSAPPVEEPVEEIVDEFADFDPDEFADFTDSSTDSFISEEVKLLGDAVQTDDEREASSKTSFALRFFIAFLLIFGMTGAGLLGFFYYDTATKIQDARSDVFARSAKFIAETLKKPIADTDTDAVYRILYTAQEINDFAYISLADASGSRIAAVANSDAGFTSQALTGIRQNGIDREDLRYVTEDFRKGMISDVPVYQRKVVTANGSISIGVVASAIEDERFKQLILFAEVAGSLMLFGLFLSLLVVKKLLAPVRKLAAFTSQRGTLAGQVPVAGAKEIAQIAVAIKKLRDTGSK